MPITADDMDDDLPPGDDGFDPAEDEVRCPECGEPIYFDAEKCSSCGHWLLRSDRREWDAASDSPGRRRLKRIAVFILVTLLILVLSGLLAAVLNV